MASRSQPAPGTDQPAPRRHQPAPWTGEPAPQTGEPAPRTGPAVPGSAVDRPRRARRKPGAVRTGGAQSGEARPRGTRPGEAAALALPFLQALSHELRTPLVVMRMAAQELLEALPETPQLPLVGAAPPARRSASQADGPAPQADGPAPPTPRRTARLLADSAERLLGLLDDLLLLHRLEAGEVAAVPETVDVAAALEAALEAAHGRADPPPPIRAAPGSGPHHAFADAVLLGRALASVLAAAIRRAGSDGVVVHLEAAGAWVVVSVAVGGPGRAADERAPLLDRLPTTPPPGQQGLASGPGLGLGLALARGCLEACGGWLRLEDAGPGAVLRLGLPRAAGGRAPGGAGGLETAVRWEDEAQRRR